MLITFHWLHTLECNSIQFAR